MKKVIIFVLISVLVLLTPALIYAENGPAEKATGSIEYYLPGYYFDFNAHAKVNGRSAKGEAWNYTPYGGWYRAEVRYAKSTDEDEFLFAAELVETNMPGWGPWVLIKVIDGGTPGTEGDMIRGQFLSMSDAIGRFTSETDPVGGPWPVLSGNLVVHTYY